MIFTLLPLISEDDSSSYKDDVSRLELLGFNYFSTPLSLIPGRLISPEGRSVAVNGSSGRVLLIVFLSGEDPFEEDVKRGLSKLSGRYMNDPFRIITVSPAEEDYKDRDGRAGSRWGVEKYPTILLTDHNFMLRGSSEGIYPDLSSEDFSRVIDRLLLDIKAPGIVNTLQ